MVVGWNILAGRLLTDCVAVSPSTFWVRERADFTGCKLQDASYEPRIEVAVRVRKYDSPGAKELVRDHVPLDGY